MNNNNRKNHSKTLAIAGMGFLLIAAAFTFSFANSSQQSVYAQQQQGGNATTIVAVPFDTFTANGVISATIGGGGGGNATAGGGGGNATAGGGEGGEQYILGGNWNLNVESGNVTDFSANFVMVHPDGTEYHTHNITNFAIAGGGMVQLVQGQETSISGTADVYTNGTNRWPGADTTLTMTPNAAVMTIMPAAEDTENHFQGQPIYGIIEGATGENGTMIAQTTPPGQQAEQPEEEGGDGGPLAPLTEPLQDLFGGGGGGGGQ